MVSPLLGQFVAGDSVLHKMSAGAKLTLVAVLSLTVSLSSSITFLAVTLAMLVCATLATGAAARPILRSLVPAVTLISFTMILYQLFPGSESAEKIEVWALMLDKDALFSGVRGSLRIVILFMASMLLFAVTNPMQLIGAVTRAMSPLGAAGIPVWRLGITLFIAIRFFPVLQAEFVQISEAQHVRGLRFGRGAVDRISRYRSLLGPALASSLRRADELADALVLRGFSRSEQPCFIGATTSTLVDWIIAFCGGALLVALALLL